MPATGAIAAAVQAASSSKRVAGREAAVQDADEPVSAHAGGQHVGHGLLPCRPRGDAAATDGFWRSLDEFTVTEPTGDRAGSVTCPNGVTRPITRTRRVTFGAACRRCPFLSRCTTSARGKKLSLHPHQALQRAHRIRAQGPDFQAVYRQHRPMVERSVAWLVAEGNRRLRFRGTQLNDLWLHRRVAGLNLRRLLNLGLTRTADAWAVA